MGSSLGLMNNRLTRFEASVFKPFLDQIIANYNTTFTDFGFVDVFFSKKLKATSKNQMELFLINLNIYLQIRSIACTILVTLPGSSEKIAIY